MGKDELQLFGSELSGGRHGHGRHRGGGGPICCIGLVHFRHVDSVAVHRDFDGAARACEGELGNGNRAA